MTPDEKHAERFRRYLESRLYGDTRSTLQKFQDWLSTLAVKCTRGIVQWLPKRKPHATVIWLNVGDTIKLHMRLGADAEPHTVTGIVSKSRCHQLWLTRATGLKFGDDPPAYIYVRQEPEPKKA
jgi:hypothetical protein